MTAFACPRCGVPATTARTLRAHLTGGPPGHRLPASEADRIATAIDHGLDPSDERIRRGPARLRGQVDWCRAEELARRIEAPLRELLPEQLGSRRPRPALVLADADDRRTIEAAYFGQDLGLWAFASTSGVPLAVARAFEDGLRSTGWAAPEEALPESGDLGWHRMWPPDVAVETVLAALVRSVEAALTLRPGDAVLIMRGNTPGER